MAYMEVWAGTTMRSLGRSPQGIPVSDLFDVLRWVVYDRAPDGDGLEMVLMRVEHAKGHSTFPLECLIREGNF
jgi:hypothetical protein